MTEPRRAPSDESVRAGLLLEAAQLHQGAASASLDRFQAMTADLDAIVRDEIRRTLIDELKDLADEAAQVVAALRAARRRFHLRSVVWTLTVATASVLVCVVTTWWFLPSNGQIGALRAERDALARNVETLSAQGGRIAWSRCGSARRLCVRIDRRTPLYGPGSDYAIARGY